MKEKKVGEMKREKWEREERERKSTRYLTFLFKKKEKKYIWTHILKNIKEKRDMGEREKKEKWEIKESKK